MIRIISPHLGDDWKSVQLKFIKKYTRREFDLYQYSVPSGTMHITAINRCMKRLDEVCQAGDICVLLDSDAFPIHPDWLKRVVEYLSRVKYVAVQRLEASEATRLAHPCFVAWKYSVGLKFAVHGSKKNPHVRGSENQRVWKGLHRTNKKPLHPRLYSVYGDIIYHHGAGSRDVSRESRFKEGLSYGEDFWKNPAEFIRRVR